jgi:hypothetical protein
LKKNIDILNIVMSNYPRQLPPQFNNRYINNGLINGYQEFMNNNTPFNKNSILSGNPLYHGSIKDADFYDRVNMAKRENLKKYKSVTDFKLSKEQLINYVINPIKINKITDTDKRELKNTFNERFHTYVSKNEKDAKKLTEFMKTLYKGRTNAPYKNILKDEAEKFQNKKYENIDDLIVHRVSQLDKNKIKLLSELELLMGKMETHDNELKIIYSVSEKSKHKEQFNYVKKYKNRIKYDPKNYNELKLKYKKEQNKLSRAGERIDEMIELLLANDQLSKEDIIEIQKSTVDIEVENLDHVFEIGEKNLEKDLEQKIIEQIGKDGFKKIKEELNYDTDSDTDSDTDNNNDVIVTKKVSSTTKIISNKKCIQVSTKKIITNNIGHVDIDELNEYKNRKKNNNK